MKIISLSSSIAGPACAVAKSIKKYFYNNNYVTNIFDYLEISLLSIIQILSLKDNDINFLHLNNNIYLNKDNNYSVKFNNFDKIISHHDLIKSYNEDDYNNLIKKYIRRYYRLINDIKNEDKIFFIRYGLENKEMISYFLRIISELNPKLQVYFIIVDYNEDNKNNNLNNDLTYIYINLYDNNNKIDKNTDLFFKTMQLNWNNVYNIIINFLDINEKNKFIYYN